MPTKKLKFISWGSDGGRRKLPLIYHTFNFMPVLLHTCAPTHIHPTGFHTHTYMHTHTCTNTYTNIVTQKNGRKERKKEGRKELNTIINFSLFPDHWSNVFIWFMLLPPGLSFHGKLYPQIVKTKTKQQNPLFFLSFS